MYDTVEMHRIKFSGFVEALEKCKGNVWLITDEGDKLNLKSRFCQILGLSKIMEGGVVTDAKIICDDPDDESLLFRFNLYGENVLAREANKDQ